TLRAARVEHSALLVDLDEEAILAQARARAATSTGPQAALTPAAEVLLLAREKPVPATARSEAGYVVLRCESRAQQGGETRGQRRPRGSRRPSPLPMRCCCSPGRRPWPRPPAARAATWCSAACRCSSWTAR